MCSALIQQFTQPQATPITVAYGDGIGPEIMEATLYVLAEAKARIKIETIEVGQQFYEKGVSTGIPPAAWESIHRTKVLLKAPITTPQGGGYKSLNVTMRKTLGLYANIRPCISYYPYVETKEPRMNMVIVRENEEDLYAGIEYRQTHDAFQSVKIITQSGAERIHRYAFEYAKQYGRKKITCMSKDNIMKMTDGCFHQAFEDVAKEYPDIENEHYIIDIGSARIAAKPHLFDVIVTENLYGDIISDIAAEVSGSVGIAGSANIGAEYAMFEAIHGSAPDIAGQGIANPSGLIQGAIMMLVHLGDAETANKIQNAWLKTIEDGIHTGDIYGDMSKQKVGTMEFAKAVVERLGEEPDRFPPAHYSAREKTDPIRAVMKEPDCERTLVGFDLFVHWRDKPIDELGKILSEISDESLALYMISCKGLKVWPDAEHNMDVTDRYRCRFRAMDLKSEVSHTQIAEKLMKAAEAGVDYLKIENLFMFDDQPGFVKSAGE
ncbi:MAG: NADP-dependent isocitrate dehydrogenase [Rickettsiales bacterium]|nr:NADP-dependent isocitrate dehydrogenase [Rickettsiales bacterium]